MFCLGLNVLKNEHDSNIKWSYLASNNINEKVIQKRGKLMVFED